MPCMRSCQQCHASFAVIPARVRRGGGKYCSVACKNLGQALPGVMRTCLYCALTFRFMPASQHDGKYCSWLCYSTHRGAVPLQERLCAFCGTLFLTDITTIRRGHGMHCSRPCAELAHFSQGEARFWQRVIRCKHPSPCITCCWLWQGNRGNHGYGTMHFEAKRLLVHRASWAWSHGEHPLELDPSLVVRHLCHTPLCVNPCHLALGTQADNMEDSAQAGRISRGEQHAHAKLTITQVQSIRLLHAEGMSSTTIATLFPVSPRSIRDVCARITWRHVS